MIITDTLTVVAITDNFIIKRENDCWLLNASRFAMKEDIPKRYDFSIL
jgi:hypothetical protein